MRTHTMNSMKMYSMKNKTAAVMVISFFLLILGAVTVSATSSSSPFAFGGILQAPYGELEDERISSERFGLRAQLNLNPLFAVSADFFAGDKAYYAYSYPGGFSGPFTWDELNDGVSNGVSEDDYDLYARNYDISMNLIFRLPLGPFEPRIGLGPAFLFIDPNTDIRSNGGNWQGLGSSFDQYIDDTSDGAEIDYNLLAGLDVHFSSWFTLGAEVSFRYDAMGDMRDDVESMRDDNLKDILSRGYAGISAKVRL
ncbi:MAG: hypothetical protein K9K78_01825 [Spirochaetales bacterium]|nr:hypothetical protein [Spirochaetales bacterium]